MADRVNLIGNRVRIPTNYPLTRPVVGDCCPCDGGSGGPKGRDCNVIVFYRHSWDKGPNWSNSETTPDRFSLTILRMTDHEPYSLTNTYTILPVPFSMLVGQQGSLTVGTPSLFLPPDNETYSRTFNFTTVQLANEVQFKNLLTGITSEDGGDESSSFFPFEAEYNINQAQAIYELYPTSPFMFRQLSQDPPGGLTAMRLESVIVFHEDNKYVGQFNHLFPFARISLVIDDFVSSLSYITPLQYFNFNPQLSRAMGNIITTTAGVGPPAYFVSGNPGFWAASGWIDQSLHNVWPNSVTYQGTTTNNWHDFILFKADADGQFFELTSNGTTQVEVIVGRAWGNYQNDADGEVYTASQTLVFSADVELDSNHHVITLPLITASVIGGGVGDPELESLATANPFIKIEGLRTLPKRTDPG